MTIFPSLGMNFKNVWTFATDFFFGSDIFTTQSQKWNFVMLISYSNWGISNCSFPHSVGQALQRPHSDRDSFSWLFLSWYLWLPDKRHDIRDIVLWYGHRYKQGGKPDVHLCPEWITVRPNHSCDTLPFSSMWNMAENASLSSCGRSEQRSLHNLSGNIGTVLSTRYTEVARLKASSSSGVFSRI